VEGGEKGPTCRRVVCGISPEVKHQQKMKKTHYLYEVTTWKGEEVTIDEFFYQPILKSFDSARYSCQKGYTTDGRIGPEGRTFSIGCLPSGGFSRPLSPETECQPVICDDPFLPSVQNSKVTNKEGEFVFDEVANFECLKGHTLTGMVGGEASFGLTCESTGQFKSTDNKCKPIFCEVPAYKKSSRSKASVLFGENVMYACDTGFSVGGLNGAAHTSIIGSCAEDGFLKFPEDFNGCEHVKCGPLPPQPNVFTGETCEAFLFENDGFEGWSAKFEVGDYKLSPMQAKGAKNDGVSSMKVSGPPGCTVELYEMDSYGGWTASFGPGEYSHGALLAKGAKNDAVSSLKVIAPKVCEVILYQEGGFGGWSASFQAGSYDVAEMEAKGAKNDAVSSMKVLGQPGCRAILFQHGGFKGWEVSFGPGIYNVGDLKARGAENDDVSSLKVDAPVSDDPRFGDVFKFLCKAGTTLGGTVGADKEYEVSCGANGKLSGGVPVMEGPAIPGGPPLMTGTCEGAKLRVSGLVTDAQDGRLKLKDLKVTFSQGGLEVASAFTDAAGVYAAKVPPGTTKMKVEGAGYITNNRGPLDFVTDIRPGQVADAGMSKPLPEDAWRVVLSWGERPRDLDSHIFFGCDMAQHVSYLETLGSSERGGGLQVALDRDDVDGYGPETVTMRNTGKCKEVGCCMISFMVHRYSKDMKLKESKALVTLYKGSSEVAKYEIPNCLKDSEDWWTAFTIDASTGENKAYAGAQLPAPYVKAAGMGVKSWGTSMDSAQWSTVETVATGAPALLVGINMQDRTALHRLDSAKYYDLKGGRRALECRDVSWVGKLKSQEWAMCPEGYYLNGFYRSGSKYDGVDGVEQLTTARCCKAKGSPPVWGTCHEQDMRVGGWSECSLTASGLGASMVGLKTLLEPGVPPTPAAYDGPLAKHGKTSSGVFIGGEYIELGFRTDNNIGKMGASGSLPAGFITRAAGLSGIGMTADAKGFSSDSSRKLVIDYVLPGGMPEESFWAGYKISGREYLCRNCGSKVEDTSPGGPVASARTTANVDGNLEVVQDVTLGLNAKFFKNVIMLKNTGNSTLTDVRYMRSVDPDNTVDQDGSYRTKQKLVATFARDGYAAVSASSAPFDGYYWDSGSQQALVMYYSDDPRAKASFGTENFSPNSTYDPRVYDTPAGRGDQLSVDSWISIAFDVGGLGPGQVTNVTYFTALDSRPIVEVVAEVKKAAIPVLTLNKMKCCSLPPAGLWEGEPACPAPAGAPMMDGMMVGFQERGGMNEGIMTDEEMV